MMKKPITFLLLLAVGVFWIALVKPAKGNVGGITITGADESADFLVSGSIELNNLISSVGPRFKLQRADMNIDVSIPPFSSELLTLIGQVAPRFQISRADGNKLTILSYPTNLINDTTSPQLTNITATTLSANSAKITWTTNEFATSLLEYGTQPGNYTQSITDDTYQKLHSLTLTGLTAGTKYYYRITNTDQSGNDFQTGQLSFTFTVTTSVYIPLITR